MAKQAENQVERQPKIRRARVDSLILYEITDSELETLEKGSPSSIYFNFSIFLLSVASSFLITLLSAKIESLYLFTIFVVITIIGFIGGVFLLVFWFCTKEQVSEVVQKIKERVPSELE